MARLIDADALMEKFAHPPELIYTNVVVDEIRSAPTIGGWVSVKDRLPDKRGNYLVVRKSHAYIGISHFLTNLRDNCQFEYEGEPNEPGFYNGDGEGDWVERDITHWMPLPDLPKEDE